MKFHVWAHVLTRKPHSRLCSRSSPQSHTLKPRMYSPRSQLPPTEWGVQLVGRVQNSMLVVMSWSCTNGVLFQPPLQRPVTLSAGRSFDAPPVTADGGCWPPRLRDVTWAQSGERDGLISRVTGAEVEPSILTSAADGPNSGQLRVLSDNSGLLPSRHTWGAGVLQVGRVPRARAMVRATCPWSPLFHKGSPQCPRIPTGGSGHQPLPRLVSAERPTFPSDQTTLELGRRAPAPALR